jgi:hypothetical protein
MQMTPDVEQSGDLFFHPFFGDGAKIRKTSLRVFLNFTTKENIE